MGSRDRYPTCFQFLTRNTSTVKPYQLHNPSKNDGNTHCISRSAEYLFPFLLVKALSALLLICPCQSHWRLSPSICFFLPFFFFFFLLPFPGLHITEYARPDPTRNKRERNGPKKKETKWGRLNFGMDRRVVLYEDRRWRVLAWTRVLSERQGDSGS